MIGSGRLSLAIDNSLLGASAGLLYIVLRGPDLPPLLFLGLACLQVALVLFMTALGFLTRNLSRMLPAIYLVGLLVSSAGLWLLGFPAWQLILGLLGGLLLGTLLGVYAAGIAPLLLAFAIFLAPPFVWPQALPLGQLVACLLFGSVLTVIIGVFGRTSAQAARSRLYVYVLWALFCGYAALSRSIITPGWNALLTWVIIVGGPAVIGYLAVTIERLAAEGLWALPAIRRWQARWALQSLANKATVRGSHRPVTVSTLISCPEGDSVVDALLWLAGRSSILHQEISGILARFERRLEVAGPVAREMAYQAFFDLPTTIDRWLRFRLEVVTGELLSKSAPASTTASFASQPFIQAWQHFVEARGQVLTELDKSGALHQRLGLPAGYTIPQIFTTRGVYRDYVDWGAIKPTAQWEKEFAQDFDPAKLLKQNPQEAKAVETFLSWLCEIKSLRDEFLQTVNRLSHTTDWQEQFGRYGLRGATELAAIMRILRQSGFYEIATGLGRTFLAYAPQSAIAPRIETELARNEFEDLKARSLARITSIQVASGPLLHLDSQHFRIVNRTRSFARPMGITLCVLVNSSSALRFDLMIDQGRSLELADGEYQIIVYPLGGVAAPVNVKWTPQPGKVFYLTTELAPA